jgi:hypothetical protein
MAGEAVLHKPLHRPAGGLPSVEIRAKRTHWLRHALPVFLQCKHDLEDNGLIAGEVTTM